MRGPTSYGYDAALHCPDCADAAGMLKEGAVDAQGGEAFAVFDQTDEADCPQHCDECHVFLYNSLTDEGVKYVVESLHNLEWEKRTESNLGVVREWADYYDHYIEDAVDIFFQPGLMLYAEDIEEEMLDDLLACSEPGRDAAPAVQHFLDTYDVVAHPDIAACLREYGSWEDEQLRDHGQNVKRLVWLMSGNFRENEPFACDFSSGAAADILADEESGAQESSAAPSND